MKPRIGILTILLALAPISAYCDIVKADSIICDSSQLTIFIECVPIFDGIPLQDGEMIIATYDFDTLYAADTIAYNHLFANNTMVLPDLSLERVNGFMDYLNLSIYSVARSCVTSKISYHYNESLSNYCNVVIDTLNGASYTIAYSEDIICMSNDSISPVTDVPGKSIQFNTDSLFCLNNQGVIFPASCQPGSYTVFFNSDYCLSSSYFDVTLLEPERLDLPDTLTMCSGGHLSGNEVYADYIFYTPGDSGNLYYTDLLADGVYYVNSLTYNCSLPDTVYVELIESPVISFNIQQECDRTIVSLNETDGPVNEPSWSNGERGNQIEIKNDTIVGVTIANSAGCVSSDSVIVEIKRLELPFVQYNKEDATCWTDGNIDIATASINNNVGGVRYQLHNAINNRIYNQLNDVPEGVYDLEVIDERNCIASFDQQITILQRCLEEYPVFTPNGDDIEDTYFIPYEGKVKIYNINGKYIRGMNTPAYWDGTDDSGNSLPMGTYVIITDNGKIVNITIIK